MNKKLAFALILPFFALWLWAISFPYFQFTNQVRAHEQQKIEITPLDWPFTRLVPDVLSNIDKKRETGELTAEDAKKLREKAYIYQVQAGPATPRFWRYLANYYYAYGEQDAAYRAALNFEKTMGIYYPSMRILAQQYLLFQRKEDAARAVSALLVTHHPRDFPLLYSALLNIMTPLEFVTTVLPYYDNNAAKENRLYWLQGFVNALNKVLKDDFVAGVTAVINAESQEVVRELLHSQLFKILLRNNNLDLLAKALTKAGYNGAYPDNMVVGFNQQADFYCSNPESQSAYVTIEQSEQMLIVKSLDYANTINLNMSCYLPIKDGALDLVKMSTSWQGMAAHAQNELLNAKYTLRVLGTKQVFQKDQQESWNEPLEYDFEINEQATAILLNLQMSIKSSIQKDEPAVFRLQPVLLNSKLR